MFGVATKFYASRHLPNATLLLYPPRLRPEVKTRKVLIHMLLLKFPNITNIYVIICHFLYFYLNKKWIWLPRLHSLACRSSLSHNLLHSTHTISENMDAKVFVFSLSKWIRCALSTLYGCPAPKKSNCNQMSIKFNHCIFLIRGFWSVHLY